MDLALVVGGGIVTMATHYINKQDYKDGGYLRGCSPPLSVAPLPSPLTMNVFVVTVTLLDEEDADVLRQALEKLVELYRMEAFVKLYEMRVPVNQ